MLKKSLSLLMIFAVLFSVSSTTQALTLSTNTINVTNTNMAITNASTPTSAEQTVLSWAVKLGTDWTEPTSAQAIYKSFIVFTVGDKLYKLNRKTGEVISFVKMAAASSWGAAAPTVADDMIFVALGDGMVQAFNAETLTPLWKSESFLGQALTAVTYSEGYLYTGFWRGETETASYVCLSAEDADTTKQDESKSAVWTYNSAGGFYGAGALIAGNAVIFQTDNGVSDAESDGASVTSLNKTTGEPISSLSIHGDGRSNISFDAKSGRIFFTTKPGYLYSASVDESGILSDIKFKQYGAQTVSTPTVFGGRVYFGIGGFVGNNNAVVVANANTLEPIYSAAMPAYPQCTVLLSNFNTNSTGKVTLYATYNAEPGGVMVLEDSAGQTAPKLADLYTPQGDKINYCMSDVIADTDGTLYYKNDSGYLFALSKKTDTVIKDNTTSNSVSSAPITQENENPATGEGNLYGMLFSLLLVVVAVLHLSKKKELIS